MSAIKKFVKINKKKKTVDIIIIRINKNGVLKNSKPCVKCLNIMQKSTNMKIKNIYYSNKEGEIIKTKLNVLLSQDLHYSWRFQNKK